MLGLLAGDHEAVAQRVKEIERERDQAQRKLKEAEDRENATRQSDRVQVERLLGLSHVVGGMSLISCLLEVRVPSIQSNCYLVLFLCRCFWHASSRAGW